MKSDSININIKLSKNVVMTFVSMCIGGLVLSVGSSFADNLRATQSVVGSELIVPYDGYLMVDSSPITGTREIKFELYEAASGGTVEWTETQTVNLYNGRFSVGLGTSTVLTDTLLDAEKLWLAMTIIDTNAAGTAVEIPLSGRQAIEPAPFAAWAANSADMQVAGDLSVAGDVTLTTGNLSVGGDLTLADDRDIYGADIIQGFNDLQLQTSPTSGSVLVLQDSLITASQDLRVEADLTVLGDTQLGNGTNDDTVTIDGVDNDGSTAALMLIDPNNARMFLDGNEIDGTSGIFLQNNTSAGVTIGSTTQINGNLTVTGDITSLGYYRDTASSSGTTDSKTLTSTDRSVCFLGRMYNEGLSSNSNSNECSVGLNGSSWELTANANGAVVECTATCITW